MTNPATALEDYYTKTMTDEQWLAFEEGCRTRPDVIFPVFPGEPERLYRAFRESIGTFMMVCFFRAAVAWRERQGRPVPQGCIDALDELAASFIPTLNREVDLAELASREDGTYSLEDDLLAQRLVNHLVAMEQEELVTA